MLDFYFFGVCVIRLGLVMRGMERDEPPFANRACSARCLVLSGIWRLFQEGGYVCLVEAVKLK